MKLITLIASHIDCTQRLTHFIKLLTSINNQIDYFDAINVRISLSHDESVSLDEIQYLTNGINKFDFKFYFQPNHMSQFEHYQFLTNILIMEKDDTEMTWILFSDDDDEWEANRLAAYHCMIMSLAESNDEYSKVSSICYTDKETADKYDKITNYLGSYTDYCVKLKYLEIFFGSASGAQLKHKFCDCYFIKFIRTYGLGVLQQAFSSTDDILYVWHQHKDIPGYGNSESLDLKQSMENILDLFMAQYSKPIAKNWIKFCDAYFNTHTNGETIDNIKTFAVKLYLEKYNDHIFHDKHLPIYSTMDKKLK